MTSFNDHELSPAARAQDEAWRLYLDGIQHGVAPPFSEQLATFRQLYRGRSAQDGPPLVWRPGDRDVRGSNLSALMRGLDLRNYAELHRWSIENRSQFWEKVVRRLGIVVELKPGDLLDIKEGPEDPCWLPGAELNIVDSCFRQHPDNIAIIQGREGSSDLLRVSYGELDQLSLRFAAGLERAGLREGDGVALYMPMNVECVAAYLGTVRAGLKVVSIADSFPAPEVYKRVELGGARMIVTVQALQRGGRTFPLYEQVKEAMAPGAVVIPAPGGEELALRTGDLRWDDFIGPSGSSFTIPGFYDGGNTWRVRFNPGEPGRWVYRIVSRPSDPGLACEGAFEVTSGSAPGFLQATPDRAWGFQYESGEPVFLLGDTVYNLFGAAHCELDTTSFMERRTQQGFNLLRVRVPVSPYHPPEGHSAWQTRRTWPWGGSEQAPRLDCFNLDYFHTVDRVVRQAERLDIGLEMIMEAWGFETPFNNRSLFLPEWEELWMRYLIARYDAFSCLYFWTLMNEYEYYPDGTFRHTPVADRWAMRMGRWAKSVAQHGHIISVHNGPREPSFARRFVADPEAINAIMFQHWGTRDRENAWLAAGIEDQIRTSLDGWGGSAVFSEYGYEHNPDLPLLVPSHRYCGPEHTRRGAWRGAFCALGVIHGFDNSWGLYQVLDRDQPGLAYLLHLRRFFTEIVPFHTLRPAPELILSAERPAGHHPLALATNGADTVAVYLPTGGTVGLSLPENRTYTAKWFDPRTGKRDAASPVTGSPELRIDAPSGEDRDGRPWDWVVVLSAR